MIFCECVAKFVLCCRLLRAQAKRALQELLDSEPEPTNDQRLSFAPLVLVVREIEKLLAGKISLCTLHCLCYSLIASSSASG